METLQETTAKLNDSVSALVADIKPKMDELQPMAKFNSEKITELEKKWDGLDNQKIKDLCSKEADVMATITATQAAITELQKTKDQLTKRCDDLEKVASRPGAGYSSEMTNRKEYSATFSRYLKTGEWKDKDGESVNPNVFTEKAAQHLMLCYDHEDPKVLAQLKELGKGGNDGYFHFTPLERLKTLVVGNNPDGGYWVETERLAGAVTRTFETSPMRPLAEVVSTTQESVDRIIDDEEIDTLGFIGEVTPIVDSGTPQIGTVEIKTHLQAAQPKVSQKILDDASINIEAWLAGKVMRKFTRDENATFVGGDGASKPRGFLALDDWGTPSTGTGTKGIYERNKLETFTVASIDSDVLTLTRNATKEDYLASSVWTMQRSSWEIIRRLKDNENRALINFELLKEDTTQILLGKPVIFFHDMEDALASDNIPIAFGDFREGYTIVDRMGMRTLRDPFTSKPFIKFYTTKRVGGDVTNYESIKRIKIS